MGLSACFHVFLSPDIRTLYAVCAPPHIVRKVYAGPPAFPARRRFYDLRQLEPRFARIAAVDQEGSSTYTRPESTLRNLTMTASALEL
jgi:hypothetical protein